MKLRQRLLEKEEAEHFHKRRFDEDTGRGTPYTSEFAMGFNVGFEVAREMASNCVTFGGPLEAFMFQQSIKSKIESLGEEETS